MEVHQSSFLPAEKPPSPTNLVQGNRAEPQPNDPDSKEYIQKRALEDLKKIYRNQNFTKPRKTKAFYLSYTSNRRTEPESPEPPLKKRKATRARQQD